MRRVANRAQIVRDEEIREMPLALQLLQEIENLRLNRHVERRDRLVGDDEIRVCGERARDADALLLPAGELVRIAVDEALAEPDGFHQLADALALLFARGEAERLDRLGDDLPDRHARIERRVRILEDHLHVLPRAAQLRAGQLRNVDVAEHHAPARRFDQPQHRAAERRLSASRFPDEPERFARKNVERHAVDRLHHAVAAEIEVDLQVSD